MNKFTDSQERVMKEALNLMEMILIDKDYTFNDLLDTYKPTTLSLYECGELIYTLEYLLRNAKTYWQGSGDFTDVQNIVPLEMANEVKRRFLAINPNYKW